MWVENQTKLESESLCPKKPRLKMPFKNSISGADPAKQNVPVPDPTKNFEPLKKVIFKGYFLALCQ